MRALYRHLIGSGLIPVSLCQTIERIVRVSEIRAVCVRRFNRLHISRCIVAVGQRAFRRRFADQAIAIVVAGF
jgi:hypothetical protein